MGLLQDRGARDRADDPIGITASEAQLKIRPDMMVEGLTTDDLHARENRIKKKCKANREEALLKAMLDSQKVASLEILHVVNTRSDHNILYI